MPRPRSNRSAAGKSPGKSIEAQRHEQDTRTNIPTAEYQSMVAEDTEAPLRVAYQRRLRDLDPQLVWRGKDEQDLDDLVVNVPPLYIQEKVVKEDGSLAARAVIARMGKAELRTDATKREQVIDLLVTHRHLIPVARKGHYMMMVPHV